MTGYAAAFLGGLFSLLSPCGALLLPAFFAYAFPSGRALLGRTLLFYLGLCLVVVPLGMGSTLATRLLYGHQDLVIAVSGWLLIGFGVLQVFGVPLWRGSGLLSRVRVGGDSPVAVLVLGAVSGVAGFCAGPVLGAVLTVAAASGDALRGAVLLAVYAAGMAAPLLVLALLWNRVDLGWLRGRGFVLGPLRLHTTSLLSGAMFAVLGVAFLVFDGTRGLSLPEAWEERIQSLAQVDVPDLAVVAAGAAVLVAVTVWRLRR